MKNTAKYAGCIGEINSYCEPVYKPSPVYGIYPTKDFIEEYKELSAVKLRQVKPGESIDDQLKALGWSEIENCQSM